MKKLLVSVLMVAAVAAWSQAPVAVPAPATPAPQTPAATQPAAAPAPSAQVVVKVEKLVVATGVENREATGAAASSRNTHRIS